MELDVISIFDSRVKTVDQLTIGDDMLVSQDDRPAIGDDLLVPEDDQPAIRDDLLVPEDDQPAIRDDLLVPQDDQPAIGDDVLVSQDNQLVSAIPQSPPNGEDLLSPQVGQSAESPTPAIIGESQNQISSLKSIIMKLDRKYNGLLKSIQKEKERIKKKTSREVLDKLSASHNEIIQSQRDKFDEIINKTNQTHDSKIKSLSEFYEEIVHGQQKKMEDYKAIVNENAFLKKDNENLSLTVSVYKERLDNIQCFLTGEKPPSSPAPKQLPLRPNTPRQEPTVKKENDNINDTIRQYERQIADLNTLVEHLNAQIQMKETMVNNMMFQINYYKDLKTSEEKERKKLEVENVELAKNFESMQVRHSEQFKDYEKLLKRSRQEINVHKREIARLRHHYANFPSSPAAGRLLRLSNDHSTSTPELRGILTPTLTAIQSTNQRCQDTVAPLASPATSYSSNPSDVLSVMSPSAVTTDSDTMDSIRMTPTPTARSLTEASCKFGASYKLKELTKSDRKLDIQQPETETESKSRKTPSKANKATTFSTPKKKNLKNKTKCETETCITLLSTNSHEQPNTPAKEKALKTEKCPSSKKKTSKKDIESLNNIPTDTQTESTVITSSDTDKTHTPAKLGASKTPKLTTSATKCSKNVSLDTKTESISIISSSNMSLSSPNTDPSLSCVSLSSTSDKDNSQSITSGADTTPAPTTKRPRGRPRKNRSPR